MKNEISILVPVYNDWEYLREMLIPSFLVQDMERVEIIIVDDGSDDKHDILKEEVLRLLNDYNFIYEEFDSNKGANVARSKAFDLCSGEYVIFSDADVSFLPGALKKMKRKLDADPKISFVYSNFFWKNEKDNKLMLMVSGEWDLKKLYENNYVSFVSMIRKKDMEKIMPLDKDIKRLQDWDFWLSMGEKGYVGKYIKEFLFVALLKEGGISSRGPDDYVYWKKRVLEKHSQRS